MSETSIWEYPSISGSSVEVGGLGASVAELQLTATGVLCVEAEAVWSIGPSLRLLSPSPSWTVTTTDKSQSRQYRISSLNSTNHGETMERSSDNHEGLLSTDDIEERNKLQVS